MKILNLLVLGLVLAMSVSAMDFPGPFAGLSNLAIVVADNALADDVIAATIVANAFGPSVALKNMKLASEVGDITRYNSVLIGSPCYHPIINQLMGYPESCQMSGMKLIRHSNGNVALLIMGSSSEIRQNARNWVSGVESTNECTDSDGGVVPDKAGVVKIPNSNDIREKKDQCYKPNSILPDGLPSGGMQVESCSKDELCYVNEAFCSKPSGQNYAVGIKYLKCPDGCSAGACIQIPADVSPGTWRIGVGEVVAYRLNGVEYEVRFSDFSNNIATFRVNGEAIRLSPGSKVEIADGALFVLADVKENTAWFFMLSGKPGCTDSDAGKNPFVRGTAYGPAPFVLSRDYQGEPVLKTDFCEKNRPDCAGDCLVEYYCESPKEMGYYATECLSGCKDGACIRVPETYDSCVSEYENKAREYETWRQNYPEGKRVREEGLRVCGDEFGRPVPPETPIENVNNKEYKKCMEQLNVYKQELVDKYTLNNIPIPADVMKDYEKRSDRCLLLAGWTSPELTVVPVPAVEPLPVETSCVGCKRDRMCLQFGIRLVDENGKPVYCDFDSFFKPQKQLGESCQNNYECMSNTCSGTCISVTERIEAVERELKEQRSLIEKILDFFKRLF